MTGRLGRVGGGDRPHLAVVDELAEPVGVDLPDHPAADQTHSGRLAVHRVTVACAAMT